MDTVRIAVVGAGNIAQNAHLPAYQKVATAEVVALVDQNLSRARYVAERFRIPKVYRTVADLLEAEEVDALDICTPTDTHYDIALLGLDAGCHLFVERPIAPTAAEAEKLAQQARRRERILMVGMRHRFRNDVLLLKSHIDQNGIGTPKYIRSFWYSSPSTQAKWISEKQRSGGGVLFDLGLVLLDLILWLLPGSVSTIYCQTMQIRLRKVEDFATVSLRFENSAVAEFTVSWSLILPELLYQLEIYGSRGSATLPPLQVHRLERNEIKTEKPLLRVRNQQLLYHHSYIQELQHFVNAVRGMVPPISTAEEAVERMRILEACYRSASTAEIEHFS